MLMAVIGKMAQPLITIIPKVGGKLVSPASFPFPSIPFMQLHLGLSTPLPLATLDLAKAITTMLPGFAMVTSTNWLCFNETGPHLAMLFSIVIVPSFPPTCNLTLPMALVHIQSVMPNPHILFTKTASNSTESPTYSQASNSLYAEK
jgi:hypothetical protein